MPSRDRTRADYQSAPESGAHRVGREGCAPLSDRSTCAHWDSGGLGLSEAAISLPAEDVEGLVHARPGTNGGLERHRTCGACACGVALSLLPRVTALQQPGVRRSGPQERRQRSSELGRQLSRRILQAEISGRPVLLTR